MIYQLHYNKYWPGFFLSTDILDGWGQEPKWAIILPGVTLSLSSLVPLQYIYSFKSINVPFLIFYLISSMVFSLPNIFKWIDVVLGKYNQAYFEERQQGVFYDTVKSDIQPLQIFLKLIILKMIFVIVWFCVGLCLPKFFLTPPTPQSSQCSYYAGWTPEIQRREQLRLAYYHPYPAPPREQTRRYTYDPIPPRDYQNMESRIGEWLDSQPTTEIQLVDDSEVDFEIFYGKRRRRLTL